jgi:hypothetical protein
MQGAESVAAGGDGLPRAEELHLLARVAATGLYAPPWARLRDALVDRCAFVLRRQHDADLAELARMLEQERAPTPVVPSAPSPLGEEETRQAYDAVPLPLLDPAAASSLSAQLQRKPLGPDDALRRSMAAGTGAVVDSITVISRALQEFTR